MRLSRSNSDHGRTSRLAGTHAGQRDETAGRPASTHSPRLRRPLPAPPAPARTAAPCGAPSPSAPMEGPRRSSPRRRWPRHGREPAPKPVPPRIQPRNRRPVAGFFLIDRNQYPQHILAVDVVDASLQQSGRIGLQRRAPVLTGTPTPVRAPDRPSTRLGGTSARLMPAAAGRRPGGLADDSRTRVPGLRRATSMDTTPSRGLAAGRQRPAAAPSAGCRTVQGRGTRSGRHDSAPVSATLGAASRSSSACILRSSIPQEYHLWTWNGSTMHGTGGGRRNQKNTNEIGNNSFRSVPTDAALLSSPVLAARNRNFRLR